MKYNIISEMEKAMSPEQALPIIEKCEFNITKSKAPELVDDKYVLIGRGYVDP